MALSDIITLLQADFGVVVDDEEQRSLLVTRINKAAEEIYLCDDLKNSKDEEVFDFDVDSHQVALPEYIGEVRGMRYFDTKEGVALEAQHNAFQGDGYLDTWYLKFRELPQRVLKREISNQSVLKFTVPLVEDSSVTITIQGPTANSTKVSETLIIPAGQLEIQGVENFRSPLASIKKSSITKYDVTVLDVEDNELAVIPNNQHHSLYHVYQILDPNISSYPNRDIGIQVLFKKRYSPFSGDNDQFSLGDAYDMAIVWKYMEHRARNAEAALFYRAQAFSAMNNVTDDWKNGKRQRFTFSPRPWFRMPYANKCR